jgi:hypothetical protein
MAQGFSAQQEIKKYIAEKNKADYKKIESAEKDLAAVNLIISEADKLATEIEQLEAQAANQDDKARKKTESKISKLELKEAQLRTTASKDLAKVNKTFFNVYKDNFRLARTSAEGDEAILQEGREIEAESNNLYKKAQQKRTQAIKISDQLKAYKILADADDLEKQALEEQLKAYGLYLKWYGKIETENIEAENETETQPQTNNNEINEELPNFVDPEEEPQTNETENELLVENKNIKATETKENIIEKETKTQPTNKTTAQDPKIFYKVQIAASEKPLSLADLRKIYNYTLGTYNNEIENAYYKYSVGQFETYEAAAKFKNSMNVPDAFITAYRNGQKISVAEANPELVPQNKGTQTKVTPNEMGVRYRIQLSAVTKPATTDDIKKMNPSPKEVQINKIGNYYKYTIGSFATADEAEKYIKQYNLKGFVVKYMDGKESK